MGSGTQILLGHFLASIVGAIKPGIVEEKIIPVLQNKLQEVENYFATLQGAFDKTNTDFDATNIKLMDTLNNIGVPKVKMEESGYIL